MIYRVTFMERTNEAGEPTETPTDYLAIQVSDGVILNRSFLNQEKPLALHSEDKLEEDDSFLSIGSETWDYEVADDRQDEFERAMKRSQMVMEYVKLENIDEIER
jgi:hypothetical protein